VDLPCEVKYAPLLCNCSEMGEDGAQTTTKHCTSAGSSKALDECFLKFGHAYIGALNR